VSRSRTCRSRSRLLWQSLGLVSKFEPGLGLGLGGYGLDYITERLHWIFLFHCRLLTSSSANPHVVSTSVRLEPCFNVIA